MSNNDYTDNIKSMFVSLSPIQALSAALPAINILLSSFIIGNTLGSSALAAVGFAGPYNYIVLGFANLVGIGSQLLCGKYIGEGNKEGIGKVFSTSTAMCTCIGLLLAVLSFLFSGSIASLMGATGELRTMTADYIKGYSLCSMFTVFSTCVLPFLQLDCAKTLSTISIVVQLVLNVSFNLLNSFVLNWGMFGVGLASSLALVVSVVICVPHLAFKSQLFKFSFKAVSKHELLEICALGWNSALIFVWLFLRDRIFNQVAFALGGTVVMSAFTIANNISNSVGGTLQGALNGPCNLIASVLVGGRDVESLRELPKVVVKAIYPLAIICYVLVFVFAKPICLMFGAEPEYIATYVLVMRLFNLWFITNPAKTAALAIYNAIKNVKAVGIFQFLGLFVYPVLVFALAKLTQSITVLFLFAAVPEIMILISFVVYYRMKTKKLSTSLTKYVYIPRSFTVAKENTLALSLRSLDEVSTASETVVEFCKSKGLSEKKSFYCGLCLEEMAADTITNGFPKVKKNKGAVDVRLVYENNSMTIMLRDNCPEFNPNEWLKHYSNEDPLRSIGLKMVKQLSEEMNYKTTIGLNVLTIKI